METDTIAAIATGSNRAAVSIIRISGPSALIIAEKISRKKLKPRHATYSHFYAKDNTLIDSGIIIYFPAPNSFTGEPVVELQGHGGVIVSNALLELALEQGARIANAGEFSLRAFLNDKIDLLQAEAINALINAETKAAMLSANRSLQGDFSRLINTLVAELINIRMYIEAGIDFPDEELELLAEGKVKDKINNLLAELNKLLVNAREGVLLTEGLNVAILGAPNVGKSSLLNFLTTRDSAIVTPIAGTTRDIIKERINIGGVLINIVDTAGIRITNDLIEEIGIAKAQESALAADLILMVLDASNPVQPTITSDARCIYIYNKIDLTNFTPHQEQDKIFVSVKDNLGTHLIKELLQQEVLGSNSNNSFVARTRHVEVLKAAALHISNAVSLDLELMAEELLLAQECLNTLTGKFTSDDLLGKIFGEFCIGK